MTIQASTAHRLHHDVGALPVPVPGVEPTAEQRQILGGANLQSDTAQLRFSGDGTVTAPIYLWGWAEYTVATGDAIATTVAEWSKVSLVLDAGGIVGPQDVVILKLSPVYKAFAVSASAVTGTLSVDLLKEEAG